MTQLTDEEVLERFEAFMQGLAASLMNGPHAQTIQDVAAGALRVVVKQHPDKSGWVITTERVADSAEP